MSDPIGDHALRSQMSITRLLGELESAVYSYAKEQREAAGHDLLPVTLTVTFRIEDGATVQSWQMLADGEEP